MTRYSLGVAFCLALAASCTSPASAAVLKVEQATLYVGAPAEVESTLVIEGGNASFDLPKQVVPESVQVTQAGAALSAALDPVYVPGAEASRPSLTGYRCQLVGLQPGQQVNVRFRTGGLSWRPGSTLTVNGARARVVSQASISNQALGLAGAKLRLMSGFLGGREGFASMEGATDYEEYASAMIERGEASGAAEAGGLHLLTELTGVDMAVGSTRQVPLVSGEVPVTCGYRWDTQLDSEYGGYHPPQTVACVYTLENKTDKPLTEGRVTVSEGTTQVGTGYMGWTPPGSKGVITISTVQGLTVRRDERSEPDPKTWRNRRTIGLRVENSRDEKVTIAVTERSTDRWGAYEMGGRVENPAYDFSQPPRESAPGAFTWDVAVPPRGQAGVTYSFHEPIDVAPLRLLSFTADDTPNERAYLVEAPNTVVRLNSSSNALRAIQPGGYIVYRLPMPADTSRAELTVWTGNGFRLSLAPEVDGKADRYTVAADGIAIAGRAIRDGSGNYAAYRFDLSPYLSGASRAVYVLIDDPTLTLPKGGAFVRMVEVLRIPQGFASRAPSYAVDPPATARGVVVGRATASAPSPVTPTRTPPVLAPPSPTVAPLPPVPRRNVLVAFTPYTPEEEQVTYYENGTGPYSTGRGVPYDGRLVYALKIPPEVKAADCVLTVDNMFVVRVARDDGGKPGEWSVVLDAAKLFPRKIHDSENKLEYTVDLTPYLKDNPSRTIYVALRPTDYYVGTAVYRVEVAALDEAEKAQLEKRKRRLDLFLQQDRDRYVLLFEATGNPAELAHLYGTQYPPPGPYGRAVEGGKSLVYRLPLTKQMAGCQFRATVDNTFVVSVAPEQNGKPGDYREAARGEGHMSADITSAMIEAGAVYLKFEYSRPTDPGGIVVKEISIQQP